MRSMVHPDAWAAGQGAEGAVRTGPHLFLQLELLGQHRVQLAEQKHHDVGEVLGGGAGQHLRRQRRGRNARAAGGCNVMTVGGVSDSHRRR